MLDPYDFADTLSRLDDIDGWLKSLGHSAPDRIRQYRQNIRNMIEVEVSGGMEALQATIPLAKAREVLWSYVEADEFVRAVCALRRCLGDEPTAAPIERALHGPADLFLEDARNSGGRNFMFELIVGGRLAAAGLSPSFDQGPDVQFEFAGLQAAVQCKRPFSASGLEKNIKKAINQLEGTRAELRLIAVSVSRLLNPGDPNNIPEVLHAELGHPHLQKCVFNIAQQTKRFWFGKMERAGILFYAFTPIHSQREKGYFPDRCEGMFPLSADVLTSTLLKCLVRSLGA